MKLQTAWKSVVGTMMMFLIPMMWGVQRLEAASVGVKLGVHRLDNNSSNSFSTRLGLFCNFALGGNFSLQPELYLNNYIYPYGGEYYSLGDTSKETVYSDKLRYLEVPLLIKYRVPIKGDLRPVVFGGLYAAFRLSEKKPELKDYQLDESFWGFYNTPLLREYPGVEGGWIIGLGLEHGQGRTRMHFDVRLNIGLTHLAKVTSSAYNYLGESITPYDYSDRNHSLSFNMGISF